MQALNALGLAGCAVKNLSTRCEGLSPFLFVYAISGNTTYVLSIVAVSMDIKHLAANAPWIAGTWIVACGSETRLISRFGSAWLSQGAP